LYIANPQLLHACANRLSSLDSLADGCPRSLAHLGVGFNAFLELSPVELAPSRWPSLMSVDVSHNELEDLVSFAATVGHGNVDIILDHLSRIPRLFTTLH